MAQEASRTLEKDVYFAGIRTRRRKSPRQSLITHKTRLSRDDDGREVRPERVDAGARLRGDDVNDRN